MKNFTLINASTVDEAVSSLTENKEKAKIIAGGTDLLGLMKERIKPVYPEVLVNIKGIPGISSIKEESGILKIGALTLLKDIVNNTTIKEKYGSLAEAAHSVGTPQLRSMGTLAGNLCQEVRCWYYRSYNNRFPCYRKGGATCYALTGSNRYNAILGGSLCFAVCPSDTAVALRALGATIVTNTRSISIDDFFIVLGNTLKSDEIITEIQVPQPKAGTKQSFIKFRTRKALDFAIASVATAITIESGTVTDARIVLGGVSPVPYRATDAETAIKGQTISESLAVTVSEAAVKKAVPLSDNKYLVPLVKGLVKKAILA